MSRLASFEVGTAKAAIGHPPEKAELAAAVEAIRSDAKERQRKGGEDKVPQTFGEATKHERETATARAKMAGTNRQYIQAIYQLAAMGGQFAPPPTADRFTEAEQWRVDHARETAEAKAEGGNPF